MREGSGPGEPKECSSCGALEELEEFPPDRRRKDGRGAKCRSCVRAVRDEYYGKHPEKWHERLERNAQHRSAWYSRNREREINRMRWNATKRKYGVDEARYYAMLEGQGGVCAICRADDPGRDNGYFAIEHDHNTNVVRGLVCHPCNVGLGMFGDDPNTMRQAALYIERSRGGRSHTA